MNINNLLFKKLQCLNLIRYQNLFSCGFGFTANHFSVPYFLCFNLSFMNTKVNINSYSLLCSKKITVKCYQEPKKGKQVGGAVTFSLIKVIKDEKMTCTHLSTSLEVRVYTLQGAKVQNARGEAGKCFCFSCFGRNAFLAPDDCVPAATHSPQCGYENRANCIFHRLSFVTCKRKLINANYFHYLLVIFTLKGKKPETYLKPFNNRQVV